MAASFIPSLYVMGQLPETCYAHPTLTAIQYSSSELSLVVGYHHLSIYPPIYHQHQLNANANCTVFPQSLAISFIFLAHSFINSHFKRRQLFSAHQSVHQGASKCIRSHIFFLEHLFQRFETLFRNTCA